ncbi:MAG: type II toxin-antitoxin system HicB family antitoxin [Candidatus Aenigmarchaeota archaeon]|nr:type II toxin-antitoxin system HicB family antitoxin [Candidatus Aenigmarchaeota archaeon]
MNYGLCVTKFGVCQNAKEKSAKFSVIIEKDEDGYYVGYVPSIRGCHTQGRTLDELMKNIKEAIQLCLEVERKDIEPEKFVGVQNVEVSV